MFTKSTKIIGNEKINKKLASMSLSREERNNYEFRKKAILDEISAIDYATKRGLQQGIEQGKIEMIKYNISIEQIAKISKLTEEEINKIIKT